MRGIKDIVKQYEGANVLILGNGKSGQFDTSEYWSNIKGGGYIWTVNGNWVNHPASELGFMMDDWKSPAHDHDFSPRETKKQALLNTKIPVITATAYEEIPCLVEYPLVDVYRFFESGYFGETISYMVAFAIYCGVKRIDLRGTDYLGCKAAERACTEMWLGRALETGIQVTTSPISELMKTTLDGRNNHIPLFYGYIPESFPFDYQTDENGMLTHLAEKKRKKK